MAIPFNFHVRNQNPSWGIPHVLSLLELANNHQDTSFVIYSILECRNLLERIEFEILVKAANSSPESEWRETILGKKGIKKVNDRFKVLKYRFQTFTEAFSKAVFENCTVKTLDFKKAEEYQTSLSQYLHIYSRTDEELAYNSEFIKEGISLINKTLDFINLSFSPINKGYIFGTVNFSTLSESMKMEFHNWLNGISTDELELLNRLNNIVETENNGVRIKVDFKT